MKRIVEDVLKAEEKVGAVLREARDKASQIRLAADKEASERISKAREKSQEIIQAAIEEARNEAAQERQEMLRRSERGKNSILSDKAETVDGLIESICEIVLRTEYERDSK